MMSNHLFNKEIWIDKWLDNENLIKIPQNFTKLRIDVGLAGDAPNSAIWLSEVDDVFVIGIEPQQFMWDSLNLLGSANNTTETIIHPEWKIVQLSKNAITQKKQIICSLKNNFLPIKTAINNVEIPGKQNFFVNTENEIGASSLRYPKEREHLIDKTIEVNVCSLEYILNHIPWDRFNYIEQIKTDCEGLDFDVIKSLGKYLNRIVYITSELYIYESEKNMEFIRWMELNNFKTLNKNGGNVNFVNNNFLEEIDINNITNKTLGK